MRLDLISISAPAIYAEAGRALNSPEAKEKLVKTGNEPVVSAPEEFSALMRGEISKWAKVAKDSGLPID